MSLLQAYLYTYGRLSGVTFEGLALSSYALSPATVGNIFERTSVVE